MRIIYESKIAQIPNLSKQSAEYKLLQFSERLSDYEKLDDLVSDLKVDEIKLAYKSFKKTTYKYEAKLRVHIYNDSEIIETPDYIKYQFSNLGKRALTTSTENNAVC